MKTKNIAWRDTTFELTEITYYYCDEKEPQIGVYAHDVQDEFSDGDSIHGDGWNLDWLEDEKDLENMLSDGSGTTYFTAISPGVYHVDA